MGRYLGLPYMIGRAKTQVFSYLSDRVVKKVNGWKKKYLSQAGCEVMIKVALQAILVYSMLVFLLLEQLIHRMKASIRDFW